MFKNIILHHIFSIYMYRDVILKPEPLDSTHSEIARENADKRSRLVGSFSLTLNIGNDLIGTKARRKNFKSSSSP